METFTLFTFNAKGHEIKLVLPEVWQAEALFDELRKNQTQLSKWLTWANKVDSVNKEVESIKMFLKKMLDGTAFNLTIFVDGQAKGMIDLHNITQESGEVGYWLSSDAQHLGIMTKSLNLLSKYAFTQLKLNYLILRAKVDNSASQHVAERCNFKYLKIEDEFEVFRLDK
ncbi:GNAT family N-acetyltransferase [Lactobacillus hamsteri]|uniref:Ribosomal-protein-serine N-acetyltransferase n=1 Tax=Lactobacillus hamsteri DSM 5661 = JCM 6256 TaxID=1423754 RepID=A0A0R1YC56_9LACO|nr:GNAT family N-acetyltransferase [Lactobacillus hamsteri]KRM40103.1 ribosomal-protein-serine N-acetyltransferase [Lactobacillus hamsteri DSM 5661 = JCM 6256]